MELINKKYLGVDIGGTAVKLGVVDQNGAVLCQSDFSTSYDNYETPIIETTVRGIREFLRENTAGLCGIGVSATGQVDVKSGVVIGGSGFIKNWNGTPIKARLEQEFGLETTVINDANAVAAAEQKFGSAAGCDDVVVVTVGTGIGGGIISGGRLMMGHRGIGGEIGHFSIRDNGVLCPCGSRGCLERYASVTALTEGIKAKPGLTARLHMGEVNGRTVFEHLTDAEVAAVVDEWIGSLAAGIVSLVHIFNPEAVVIGGGISRERERFIEPLKKRVLQTAMPCFAEDLKILPAKLGNNAGLIGAAAYRHRLG